MYDVCDQTGRSLGGGGVGTPNAIILVILRYFEIQWLFPKRLNFEVAVELCLIALFVLSLKQPLPCGSDTFATYEKQIIWAPQADE